MYIYSLLVYAAVVIIDAAKVTTIVSVPLLLYRYYNCDCVLLEKCVNFSIWPKGSVELLNKQPALGSEAYQSESEVSLCKGVRSKKNVKYTPWRVC